ncbi:hypothetical protein G7Y89_g2471 [Cudoniella acicularis]|uniref:Uncharacterized protein n=1 Tax=Cudoniella acicularis TaxID=354080 RepID=A0A8H4W6Y1_9HELO|nr:hypothetical protein G7Y89_g2471 [Cudoniella acicularis]
MAHNPCPDSTQLRFVLAVYHEKPELVWIKCFEEPDDEGSDLEGTGLEFEYVLEIWGFDQDQDILEENTCIFNLIKKFHAGTVLIMKYYPHKDGPLSTVYEDITAADLRIAAFYMMNHIPTREEAGRVPGKNVQKGVRISCRGDIFYKGMDQYMPVSISENHRIHQLGMESEICKHIGIPLLVLQLPLSTYQPRDDSIGWKNLWYNPDAQNLVLRTCPKDNPSGKIKWGASSFHDGVAHETAPIGAVLVVRKDGKDILPR